MGQKVNPVGFRLGVIKGWDSNWYGGKDFADKLVEDEKIRKYINARIQKGGISRIVIERTLKRITITINTARPGVVIGKGGQEVDKIKDELKEITSKQCETYLPLKANTALLVDKEPQRKKDHVGHFVLRLAFCRSCVLCCV